MRHVRKDVPYRVGRQLHGKEAVEQPAIEDADAEEDEIGEIALDEAQTLEQRGQAEPDNPHIETHTHAAEGLGPDPLNEERADRHTDEDAGQDVGNESEALHAIKT